MPALAARRLPRFVRVVRVVRLVFFILFVPVFSLVSILPLVVFPRDAFAQGPEGPNAEPAPTDRLAPTSTPPPAIGVRPDRAVPASSAAGSATSPRSAPQGVAVLGAGSAREAAFIVARALYAGRLRPASLDEPRARILAGDPPAEGASADLRELAELREGVRGEGAASRRVLAGIAEKLALAAILVVEVEPSASATRAPSAPGGSMAPVARLFLADSGEIDAARYGPEPGVEGPLAWRATVASLERRLLPHAGAPSVLGPVGAAPPAKAAAKTEDGSRPFYGSGWFWAAIGGAALAGTAIFFLARDTTADTIHLQMRVPR